MIDKITMIYFFAIGRPIESKFSIAHKKFLSLGLVHHNVGGQPQQLAPFTETRQQEDSCLEAPSSFAVQPKL